MQEQRTSAAVRRGKAGSYRYAALAVGLSLLAGCSAQGGAERAASSTLEVTNTSLVRVQGPRGGPFPSGQRVYTLRNLTDAPLGWTAYSVAKWLSFSDARGELQPGETTDVSIAVDQARAAMLPPGTYEAAISFRGEDDGLDETLAAFELIVRQDLTSIAVQPATGLAVVLGGDGVATPSSASFAVANQGTLPVVWTASIQGANGDWLFITGPSSGSLAPGQSSALAVSVDAFAAQDLPSGSHAVNLNIEDEDGDILGGVPVTLQVGGAPASAGWTEFEPSADSRIVYVSSSLGNVANDGFSEASPKASIAQGVLLLRHGMPDWLLLKAGDTFDEGLGQWKKSGRSASEPMLVSSYSPAGIGLGERPVLRTGNQAALVTSGGGGSPPRIEHVAFVGLHLFAHTFTGGEPNPNGVGLLQPVRDFLIEDCRIEGYSTGLVVQGFNGRHEDFRLRRSLVLDNNSTDGGNPQGLYVVNSDNVLIEENVFDSNGWDPNDPEAPADIFSHNVYVDENNSGVVLRANLIVNGASHGAQMRAGGIAEDNVFLRNTIALMMAGRAGPQQNPAVARNNVILDGRDIDSANERGWGIDFNNIVSGEIRGNIIANNVDGHFAVPIVLDGDGHGHHVTGVQVVGNVIHDWGGSVLFQGNASRLSGITFRDNVIQNAVSAAVLVHQNSTDSTTQIQSAGNRFFSDLCTPNAQMRVASQELSIEGWRAQMGDQTSTEEAVPHPAPNRSAGAYNATLGGAATHQAFMAQARRQSRAQWREEYTARALGGWIRAGFAMP